MLPKSIFRERALLRSAQPEPIDDLLRVTAPHEWLLLAALATLLLGAIGWSVFGSVERTLSGNCALVVPGVRHTVVAPSSGIVREVMASVGDEVTAGEPLARLFVPEAAFERSLARARLDVLEHLERRSGKFPDDWIETELAAARRNWLEISALEEARAVIASPDSGELVVRRFEKGQTVEAGAPVGEIRTVEDGPPDVFMYLPPRQAARIETGFAAHVHVVPSGDFGAHRVAARVVALSPWPLVPSPWLDRLGFASPGADGRLVRVALDQFPSFRARDGAPCRFEVVLGRHSLVRHLVSGISEPT